VIDDNDEDEDDDNNVYMVDHPGPAFVPSPKTFEVPSLKLTCGEIRPGSVVELKDHTGRDSTHLISGDFLWIRKIIEDVETEAVSLEGYRMRRVEYLQPLFDSMWNPQLDNISLTKPRKAERFVHAYSSPGER
jgi:DNA (cytosine-5)-methyltransferase 1